MIPPESQSASAEASPAPSSGPPLHDGIRQAVLRGSAATVIGRFAINLVRLGSNLVLTRLLLPEHFGVMAIVNVTMTGLQMFSDLGIGTAVIQSEHGDDPRYLRTAFSLQALRGVGLMFAGCVFAFPLSRIYGNMPELAWMIPIASVIALFDGFTSTKMMQANRHMRFARVLVVELSTNVMSALAMIALAYATRSVVSLLVGGIAGALTRVALSHLWLSGARDRFGWDAEARAKLLGFSSWILLSTAATFVGQQIDRLALGRLVDVAVLGVYSTAIALAAVPREVLGQLIDRVLYPLVARLMRAGAAGPTIKMLRARLLLLLVPLLAVLVGESEALFALLYSGPFETGATLLPILCFGAWLNALNMTYGIIVLAKGWPRFITYGTGLKALVFALLVLPVHGLFGIHGVAALTALSEAAVVVAVAVGCRTLGVTTLMLDLACTLAVAVLGYAVYRAQGWTTLVVGSPLPGMALFALLGLGVALLGARRLHVV